MMDIQNYEYSHFKVRRLQNLLSYKKQEVEKNLNFIREIQKQINESTGKNIEATPKVLGRLKSFFSL